MYCWNSTGHKQPSTCCRSLGDKRVDYMFLTCRISHHIEKFVPWKCNKSAQLFFNQKGLKLLPTSGSFPSTQTEKEELNQPQLTLLPEATPSSVGWFRRTMLAGCKKKTPVHKPTPIIIPVKITLIYIAHGTRAARKGGASVPTSIRYLTRAHWKQTSKWLTTYDIHAGRA